MTLRQKKYKIFRFWFSASLRTKKNELHDMKGSVNVILRDPQVKVACPILNGSLQALFDQDRTRYPCFCC